MSDLTDEEEATYAWVTAGCLECRNPSEFHGVFSLKEIREQANDPVILDGREHDDYSTWHGEVIDLVLPLPQLDAERARAERAEAEVERLREALAAAREALGEARTVSAAFRHWDMLTLDPVTGLGYSCADAGWAHRLLDDLDAAISSADSTP